MEKGLVVHKKYCLIANILLVMPLFTVSMKVEQKKPQQIWIQTSDDSIINLSKDHPLFSLSTIFSPMISGKFKENGIKKHPIKFESINGKQVNIIVKLIEQIAPEESLKLIEQIAPGKYKDIKKFEVCLRNLDPEKFKVFLQDFTIEDFEQFIVVNNFLDIKGLSKLVYPYFVERLQGLNINDLNKLIVTKDLIKIKGICGFVVPCLVKQLQNPYVLNEWIKIGWTNAFIENKELSDHIKQHLVHKIRPIPQYLLHQEEQQKSTDCSVDNYSTYPRTSSISLNWNGTMLALGLYDGTVILRPLKNGKTIHSLPIYSSPVYSVAFNKAGTIFASGSSSGKIKLWDIKTNTERLILTGYNSIIYSMAFNKNNTMFASGSADGIIKLWNVKNGTKIRTFTGNNSIVYSLSFNKHDTILASGLYDKTIKLWDVEKGTEICTLSGHTKQIFSVKFNKNNTMLTSGAWDGTIRHWNFINSKELSVLELLLIHSFQRSKIANLNKRDLRETYPELYKIYKASSLAKTLIH